jgi:hypothetical protein
MALGILNNMARKLNGFLTHKRDYWTQGVGLGVVGERAELAPHLSKIPVVPGTLG